MTTREDVVDAISQIERAGHAGDETEMAQVELLLPVPAPEYARILGRLRTAFPKVLPVPAPEQQGAAAQAMKSAEAALAQQQSTAAEFDRQVIQALLHAHQTNTAGRQRLDELENQIEIAAQSWDLSTPLGAREFQRFLITKLGQITRVVDEADDDAIAKQALTAAWAVLYASQTDRAATASNPGNDDVRQSSPAASEQLPVSDAGDYLDQLPQNGFEFGDWEPNNTPLLRAAPAIPKFGGATPALSAGMAPVGPSLASPAGLERALFPAGIGGEPVESSRPEADPATDGLEGEPASRDPDTAAAPVDPNAVTLPDGQTIQVSTPLLAAVLQSAADGTPVAEAFRQQGITIPPPGTPVSGPIDPARVGPGDIGMFTDRQAIAVSSSTALLNGELHDVADIGGPSFLGWQHPPIPGEEQTILQSPAPTRLSANVIRR